MKILVTGGAGFIGSHLCEKLLKQGHEVICLDNLFTGSKKNIESFLADKNFKFIEHDIIEPFFTDEKIDQIYNLACPASPVHYQLNAIRTVKANTIGIINMLGLAKAHGARILQASTSEVYGDPSQHPQKENYFGNVNPIGPRACYDEGKRVAETLFFDYCRKYNLEIRVARIFNTYGPKMSKSDGRVVSNFIIQALANEDIAIYGDGAQTRSFCYVSDLVNSLDKLMNKENFTGPVNLGNPVELTVKEIAEKIISLTDSKSRLVYKPLPKDDPKKRRPDITIAKEKLNWSPEVKLEDGLKQTIEYFNMKKILIFSTAYLPLVGGAEIAVKELTDRLTGFEFDLITARLKRSLAKQEKIGRVMVYRIGSGYNFDKFLLPILGLIKAIRLNRKNDYELNWAIMASFGALAAWLFKKINRRIPYLLTLQEGDSPEHIYSRAKWLGPYYKKMFTQADFITAISYYLKDFALKQGATAPVEIVPNGVDVKKFKIESLKFKVEALKSSLNIKDSEKVIITVSRLVEKNGVGDLIEAMRYLPVGVKLLIIGGGELEAGYKLQIANCKLGDRVIILGAIKNEEVPPYLALADAFVRPSISEGQGIAFLEAMAAGVPVVATPVGGIVDFLRDPSAGSASSQQAGSGQATGLFCEVNNSKSIAGKVKILLDNKELAETIKINARELVVKNYDWNLLAEKMKTIFEKLLAGK